MNKLYNDGEIVKILNSNNFTKGVVLRQLNKGAYYEVSPILENEIMNTKFILHVNDLMKINDLKKVK